MNIEDIDKFFTEYENVIIGKILFDDRFFKKTFGKVDNDSLFSVEAKELIKIINKFRNNYKRRPSIEDIITSIKNYDNKDTKQLIVDKLKVILSNKEYINNSNTELALDETEKYIKYKKLRDFIILQADKLATGNINLGKALDNLKNIMGLSFDEKSGLEFTEIDKRLEYYKKVEFGVKTGIFSLDKLIFPGFKPKTLNVIAAASGAGKSALMAGLVANILQIDKKNVLVITLEMSEYEWIKRVDANLFDIPMNEFRKTPDEVILSKYNNIKDKIGKLRVIERPTGSLSPTHVESILDELYDTEKFTPDIVVIDYLTIMRSDRAKDNSNTNAYYGSVAEDLRAVAIKYNVPILTGSQLTREGTKSENVDQSNIAYAKSIYETADVVFSLIAIKDREEVILSAIKNRNTGIIKSITLKSEFDKMKFTDLDMPELYSETDIIEEIKDESGIKLDEWDKDISINREESVDNSNKIDDILDNFSENDFENDILLDDDLDSL